MACEPQRFRATEIPAAEREPILDTYRSVAGRHVRTYFHELPDPADHPVFRIEVGGEVSGEA
jgi:hypothetical protein